MPPEPSDHEARITSLEARMNVLAIAAATRDRDIGKIDAKVTRIGTKVDLLEMKVDANREAINSLGVQTAERFAQIDRRFEQVDRRFDALENEMREGFALTAAGQQRIVEMLDRLLGEDGRS